MARLSTECGHASGRLAYRLRVGRVLCPLYTHSLSVRLSVSIVTPDGLPPLFFSRAAVGLTKPLQLVFNLSLRAGKVLTAWKRAYVKPSSRMRALELV